MEFFSDPNLVRAWSAKALVCICGPGMFCRGTPGEWCGPQRSAAALLREIRARGIQLPPYNMAILEDVSCGRRKHSAGVCEFDEIMTAAVAKM